MNPEVAKKVWMVKHQFREEKSKLTKAIAQAEQRKRHEDQHDES